MTGKLRKKLFSASVALCLLLSGNNILPLLASPLLRADDAEISSETITDDSDPLNGTVEDTIPATFQQPEEDPEETPGAPQTPETGSEVVPGDIETPSSVPDADGQESSESDDPDGFPEEDAPDPSEIPDGSSDPGDLDDNRTQDSSASFEESRKETDPDAGNDGSSQPQSENDSTSHPKNYITYTAKTGSGIQVQAAAPAGAFAKKVTMKAEDVTVDAQMMALANSSLEENQEVKGALAVDIRFIDDDGNVQEPLEGCTVQVNITLPEAKVLEGDSFSVLHMTDEGATEVEDAQIDENGGSFTTDSFSIYVLTAVGEMNGQEVHDWLDGIGLGYPYQVGEKKYVPNSTTFPYLLQVGETITLVAESTDPQDTFGLDTNYGYYNNQFHLSVASSSQEPIPNTSPARYRNVITYTADTPGMARVTFANGDHNQQNDFYIGVVPEHTDDTRIFDMRSDASLIAYNTPNNPYCVEDGDILRIISDNQAFWFVDINGQSGDSTGRPNGWDVDGTMILYRYGNSQQENGYWYNDVHASRGSWAHNEFVAGCSVDIYGTRTIYFKVLPGKVLDHADIEIADGGKYTSTRIYIENGKLYKQVDYYFTYVEEVNECILYQSNGETVRFFDGNGNTLWYDEAQGIPRSGYTTENYAKNPTSTVGQSQYELTSKYRYNADGTVDTNSFSNIKYNYKDVDHASFDVQMYRVLSKSMVYEYDPDQPQGQEWTFKSSTAYEDGKGPQTRLNHVVFELTHTHVVDALNKCPNQSGLDFTLHANSAMIQLAASKELLHGTLGDGAFQFELRDSSGKLIQQVANSADGTVLFDEIHFEKAGTYTYYISETVDPAQTNIHYDERVYEVNIKVTETTDGLIEAEIILPNRNLSDVDYKFVNEVMYTLPDTGGGGTAIFHQAGAVLLISAAILLFLKKAKVMDL